MNQINRKQLKTINFREGNEREKKCRRSECKVDKLLVEMVVCLVAITT